MKGSPGRTSRRGKTAGREDPARCFASIGLRRLAVLYDPASDVQPFKGVLIRQFHAHDLLAALDAVHGGVAVDEQLCRRLGHVAQREQIAAQRLVKIRGILPVGFQQRFQLRADQIFRQQVARPVRGEDLGIILRKQIAASARSVQVNTLNKNYGYYFWVVSVNEVGECEMNAENRAFADVLNPIVVVYPPLQPLTVTASALSRNTVEVTWTKSPSSTVQKYRVYYNTVNNPATAAVFADTTGPEVTAMTLFHLKPLTKYYFWVAAVNDAGASDLDSYVCSSAWTLY